MKTRYDGTSILVFVLLLAFFANNYSTQRKFVQTELYFGLSQPDGAIISDSAWQIFVQAEVSKVFSEGFTIVQADGNWVDEKQKKMHVEPSRIVMSAGAMSSLLSARIDSLREKYKTLFRQESVLRIDTKTNINF